MIRLYLVAYFGVKAIVQLLLEKGADVNAADVNAATRDGWTPLHWASFSGHVEAV
jgi:ankyrin repeat protein